MTSLSVSPVIGPHPQPRFSDALLQIYRTKWMSLGTTSMFLLLQALFRLIRTVRPVEDLEKEVQMAVYKKVTAAISSIWPTINPFSNINKMFYYEFKIGEHTNECEWIMRWLVQRVRSGKEKRQVKVQTGLKNTRPVTKECPGEDPAVSLIRKEIGYSGLPFMPEFHWFMYRGSLFRVHDLRAKWFRENGATPPGPHGPSGPRYALSVRLYATSRAPFLYWLDEAKKRFEAASPAVIDIVHFDGDDWDNIKQRQKRNFDDVILTKENRDKLEHLVQDFLNSGGWYLSRGLSWKNGILLHGPPGCGKTSTIVGLASKYDLNLYMLSLNDPDLTDEGLASAIGQVRQRSIVCLEDCDIWAKDHNRRLAEKAALAASGIQPQPQAKPKATPTPTVAATEAKTGDSAQPGEPGQSPKPQRSESRLTLAGLLNILDGVNELKGILFILTTNDPSSLDSALIRPGRVDAYIELTRATRQQAEDLFNSFYKPYDEEQPDYELSDLPKWAKTFSSCIDHCEFSPASLQAFLLEHRLDPAGAAAAMADWVYKERTSEPSTLHPFVGPIKEYPSRLPHPNEAEPGQGSAAGKSDVSHKCKCADDTVKI